LAEAVLMEARGSGSTFPNITSDRLTAQLVALPSLPEQRKIAAILSSVDEAIEGTQAVIDQLQVVKKAMMADLLTRGIPGRHKKFKQTEIGEVPEDWEVVPMGTVATIGNGSTPSKARPDYWDGGTIPWLPTGKVNDYIIRTADSFVTEKALAECPIRLLPRGTVLVAMIGQGKTRGMVAYLDVEATINQNFAYVAPGAAVRSWFLFAFLNHVYGELRGSGRGSNQDALNCGILKAFPVPVPQVDEQEMIARGCFALDERIIREADAVSGLLELKSALMSVLLTGEVRVRVDEESAA
jgi:type I restriction enzyme S subunit